MRLYLACLALRLATAAAIGIDIAHLWAASRVQIARRWLVAWIDRCR